MLYVHYTTDRELPWKVRDGDGVVIGEFATGVEAHLYLDEWKKKRVATAEAIDEKDLDEARAAPKVEGDDGQ